jgi:hypothetical protein
VIAACSERPSFSLRWRAMMGGAAGWVAVDLSPLGREKGVSGSDASGERGEEMMKNGEA